MLKIKSSLIRFRFYHLLFGRGRWILSFIIASILSFAYILPALQTVDLFPINTFHAGFFFKRSQNTLLLLHALLPYFNAFLAFLWFFWLFARIPIWFLGSGGHGQRRSGRSLVSYRTLRLLLMGALLVITLPSVILLAWRVPALLEARGHQRAFRSTCSMCHSAQRPLHFIRSQQAWAITIDRMKTYAGDRMSTEQAEAALAYLVLLRSASPETLFRIKCLACHDDAFTRTTRTPDDWARLVDRLARFNGFYLTQMQAESILEHIRAVPLMWGPETLSPGLDDTARVLYESRCVHCHTLDIILLPGIADEDWGLLLARMSEKAPWLATVQEARGLEPWIVRMRQDPDRFRHEVPHQSSELFWGKSSP